MNRQTQLPKGKKFGWLTVVDFAYRKKSKSYWKCLCDCGNEVIIVSGNLKTGMSRSCGCLRTHKYKPGESGLRSLYLKYKKSAKREGRIFNLAPDEFKELTSGNCSYCGMKPSKVSSAERTFKLEVKSYTTYIYNGIDRIDSSKGYETGNVTSCCRWCNVIKRERTVEEFRAHVKRIVDHLGLAPCVD